MDGDDEVHDEDESEDEEEDEDEETIEAANSQSSATSDMTRTTTAASTTSSFYLDKTGSLHRLHVNGRSKKAKEAKAAIHLAQLIRKLFNNTRARYLTVRAEFEGLMAVTGPNKNAAQGQGDGMLRGLQLNGATFKQLQAGFGIGINKFKRLAQGGERKKPGGATTKKIGDAGATLLRDFVAQLPTELGYPCGHRRQMTYLALGSGEQPIKSQKALWEQHCLPYIKALRPAVPAMAEKTFCRYLADVRISCSTSHPLHAHNPSSPPFRRRNRTFGCRDSKRTPATRA